MNEYPLLGKIARGVVAFFLVAFAASTIHLGVTKDETLFKINSPLIYPALVCLVLLICLVLDSLQDRRQRAKQAGTPESETIRDEYRLVTGVFLGLFVYVLLLKYVTLPFATFPWATVLYTTFITVLINDDDQTPLKKGAMALLVSTILVLSIYYSFSVVFEVILP